MPSAEATIAASARDTWTPEAHRVAERALQDTLAIGIAGLQEPAAKLAARSVAEVAPVGHGVRPWLVRRPLDVASAAFVLGTACHCLDWDDFMHPMHGHGSAVLLPTAWSVVESVGGGGADLVAAYLAGYQVNYLTALVLSHGHYHRGWHATSTIGAIGAAATAAVAMGLNEGQTAAALGIVASSASGLRTNFGTPTKALHAGIAARHGVEAAQLARAGVTSSTRWLTGPAGMSLVMGGDVPVGGAADVVAAARERGEHGIETPWGLIQKPFSCCGACHGAVDALIQAVTEHDVRADQIASIDLHVDPVVPTIMRETIPTDSNSARYSLTWVMAASALDRACTPAQFSAEALVRADIMALRERVRVLPDLTTTDHDRFAGRVVVHLAAGGSVERTVTHAIGHPLNPMSETQRRTKQAAALHSVMSVQDADATIDACADLTSIPDLRVFSADLRRRTT